MKKLALVVVGCAASLLLGAAPASADNGPHVAGASPIADSCAGCHRAHTAKAPYLLKSAQETLCFTCHGTAGTGANTDVQNGVGYTDAGRSGGPAGALRGGGFEYALIDSANPSGQSSSPPNVGGTVPVRAGATAVTSAHSVDSSDQTAWGNGPTSATVNYGSIVQLRCGSCHDPHGNGNYRILKTIPMQSAASPDVTITDTATKVYTTGNYWQVEDTNAPGFIANISEWCATCHTRYLSDSATTDTGDAVFNFRHRSDQTSQGSANCIQCHVAHGSNATMGTNSGGVHNPDGVPAPAGSRLLRIDDRGVCQMCHL